MTAKTANYTSQYFTSKIFETDYATLAAVIIELYHPQTVVEFGCGPGHLSRELAQRGVQVTCVDGYSQPNFAGLSVEFYPLDLNDSVAIKKLFEHKQFDLSICLEVAEHLEEESSQALVKWLTQVAPIVIFSAAVPNQKGRGHINLQTREYWHNIFSQREFVIADRIREKLRNSNIAPWYRYNVIDYIQIQHPQAPNLADVLPRLIASESAAASGFYDEYNKRLDAEEHLKSAPTPLSKLVNQLGSFAKGLLRRS
ncbi:MULTISPECIES: class I SAM-dependent methyltransferase [Calothrix]|uniref:Class I SAM-dependent methyltransferase n=2 Tax=Calothrix TaxID=1186 RepID=A0ABR8AL52_9CYAN|nr:MULTISPECIES: class I SAM-dependent methyltransferase [Calothrix]MBD2200762.1 class I SAM-dependent methyltransferase [Calothrix parietina FACHB-288]MBD2227180.1 class I SAM-dependent methyltransferase [Calothrix anomala FACHB-343]